MLLITSAAYGAPELSAEFGRLPPAFLPVGNRRLFVHQHRVLATHGESVYLSLPDDFVPDVMDQALLARLGITVLPVPAGLTLGQSVVWCLNVTHSRGETLRLLHGDTLIEDVPAALDVVSVGVTRSYYRWTELQRGADGATEFAYGLGEGQTVREVLSGYFAFADASLLVSAITRASGDFIQGLTLYGRARSLMPVTTGVWRDFGSLHTYYQSRAATNTARAFNTLAVNRHTVRKSGQDAAKIAAEAAWYEALPPALRRFVPAFLGRSDSTGSPAYVVEHLFLPTLADLFIFGRLPPFVWLRIFDALDEYLTVCAASTPPAPAMPERLAAADALYHRKVVERLELYTRTVGIDPEHPWELNGIRLPGLATILRQTLARIPPASAAECAVIHGDFCFSNIFYDFRSESIRVIDPRGLDANDRPGLFGDRRYDLAKLRHSVVGRYDVILAGYYRVEEPVPYRLNFTLAEPALLQSLEVAFCARSFAGLSPDQPAIRAITILLFLSMLPLHADDRPRQSALLANALRLFAQDAGYTVPLGGVEGSASASPAGDASSSVSSGLTK